jgi:hypothetical protein
VGKKRRGEIRPGSFNHPDCFWANSTLGSFLSASRCFIEPTDDIPECGSF